MSLRDAGQRCIPPHHVTPWRDAGTPNATTLVRQGNLGVAKVDQGAALPLRGERGQRDGTFTTLHNGPKILDLVGDTPLNDSQGVTIKREYYRVTIVSPQVTF